MRKRERERERKKERKKEREHQESESGKLAFSFRRDYPVFSFSAHTPRLDAMGACVRECDNKDVGSGGGKSKSSKNWRMFSHSRRSLFPF